MSIRTAIATAIGAEIANLMRRKMFKLEDKNKWTRPIDAEFIDIAGNPKSSRDYDRVWNKPRGWTPQNRDNLFNHHAKQYVRAQQELGQYRRHYFGRFVRACIYITLACAIGYKWGANNPVVPLDTRSPAELSQWSAKIACNNLLAYKLAKMPENPWDVMECAVYKKRY